MAGKFSDCATALEALQHGPGHFACHDYDTVREVVMCKAWHDFEGDTTRSIPTFGHAVKQAWADMRTACQPQGGIDHEINTPEEVEYREGRESRTVPDLAEHWKILNTPGQTVGTVAVESDGAITTCIHGDCHTDFKAGEGPSRSAIVAAMRDIYPTVGYHLVKGA